MRSVVLTALVLVHGMAMAADAGKQGGAAPATPAAAAPAVEKPAAAPAADVATATAPVATTATATATAAPVQASAADVAADIAADEAADAAAEAGTKRGLVPFYAFHFSEGLSLPNIGGFFFGNKIGSTVGGKVVLTPEQSLFGAYELSYEGPGMRAQEGHEFRERSIDHSISAGHAWKVSPAYVVSSRIQYMNEFRRTGANESFGNGLYDYWSLGLAERVDLGIVPGVPLGAGLAYAYVRFPNYTDLLQEFMSASVNSELSGGQQDYHRIRFDADGRFGGDRGRGWLSVSMLDFIKARVVTGFGTAAGPRQVDYVTELGGSWKAAVAQTDSMAMTAEPVLRVTMRNSNQNFLRFRHFGDTLPSFIKGNYNYVSPSLGVPVRWEWKNGRSLFFAPTYALLAYGSRPPRDTANEYRVGKKQLNQTLILAMGYTSKFYAYSSWTFGYAVQVQKSNNRFEKFLPYNYTGHLFYTSLDITY